MTARKDPIKKAKKPRRQLIDYGYQHPDNERHTQRTAPVTVCIAAACLAENPARPNDTPFQYIIGATDRRLTAGDIQFEPPYPKVLQLGPGIAALIAGDAYAQAEICDNVWRKRKPRSVVQAVEAYSKELGRYNRKQAERKALFPFGVNAKSFADNPQCVPDWAAKQFFLAMTEEKAGVTAIICGVDDSGNQIYTVDRHGRAFCNTAIGFAAIGEGEWHASSQFMFAKYTAGWSLDRALMLLYIAKQRAEVAPSVGKDTDIFFLSYQQGPRPFNNAIYAKLAEEYDSVQKSQAEAIGNANREIAQFLAKLHQPNEPQQPQTSASPPEESADGKAVEPPTT